MKLAAVLTAHVMDRISHLPGVATLDWCDRAAAAVSALSHPSVVSVALCQLDGDGFIMRLESAGAARSAPAGSEPETGYIGSETDMPDVELEHLRRSHREGEWLGWPVGPLQEGRWFVGSAGAMGLLQRRNEGPLSRRWDRTVPADVLLGAVTVPGERGRMLVVELGLSPAGVEDVERISAVLSAALPLLSVRVVTAIGTSPADERTWLTPREELVMWHLVAGKKVPQIAKDLGRSVYTVHDHVKSLHRKLGASNRGQLVARALGHLGPLAVSDAAGNDDDAEEEGARRHTAVPVVNSTRAMKLASRPG